MKKISLMAIILVAVLGQSMAQLCVREGNDWVNTAGGECRNVVLTAVPFLRITPDARAGSLGDAGIAISPDANSIAFNASKLAFAEKDYEISATFTPWLRQLGVTDVYLAYLAGYYKIDDLQTISGSLRFFNLGEVQFTDLNGESLGVGMPVEMEISAAYARKLSENFAIGLTGKFIYSNLASGQTVQGNEIIAGTSVAADLSATYNAEVGAAGNELTIGLAITNLGSKITYIEDLTDDFIPTNLGLGAAYTIELDEYNKITLAADVNKLMVPTSQFPTLGVDDAGNDIPNPEYDKDQNDIADFREQSLFEGVFGSFGDAPNGFSEEMEELSYSFAAEYTYNNALSVRLGHFNEHQNKGNRKYITAGVGIEFQETFGINFSYLIPTTIERSPLDNTLRFSLFIKGLDYGGSRAQG